MEVTKKSSQKVNKKQDTSNNLQVSVIYKWLNYKAVKWNSQTEITQR